MQNSTPNYWQWFPTTTWKPKYYTLPGTTKSSNYYTPSSQQCYVNNYNYYSQNEDFGAQSIIYSIADSFSDGVAGDILSSSQTRKLFNYIYYGTGDTIDIIDDANTKAGPIIAESVGGFFVLLSSIFAICFFIRRCICCCCCSKKNQQVQTFLSTRSGYMTQIILYLVLFGFIVAGTITYGLSLADLNNGIIYNDCTGYTKENYNNGIRDLDCTYQKYIRGPFNQQSAQIQQLPQSLTYYWLNDSGVFPLSQFDTNGFQNDLASTNSVGYKLLNSLKKLKNPSQQCKSQIDSVTKIITKLNSDTSSLLNVLPAVELQNNNTYNNAMMKASTLNRQLQVPTLSQLSIFGRVQARISTVNQGLHLASSNAQGYADHFADFITRGAQQWENNNKQNAVRVVSLLVVVIPMCVIMLAMVVAIVTCILRFFFPRVHIPIILTGPVRIVINIGAYTVIFTAWLIWLVALSYYWISNPFSTTCYQTQNDYTTLMNNYNSLNINFVPYTTIALQQLTNSSVPYGTFLQTLQSGSTLVSTLNYNFYNAGKYIFDSATVLDDLDMDYYRRQTYQVIDSADLSVYYDSDTFYRFNDPSNSLTRDASSLDNLGSEGFLSYCYQSDAADVVQSLINYNSLVDMTQTENYQLNDAITTAFYYNSNSQSRRYNMEGQSNNVYYDVQNAFSFTLSQYNNQLNYYTYPSNAIRIVYDNTWDVLCSQIRSPLDGIWASAGLIAIVMIPVGFLLYKTARVVVEKKKPVARNVETNVNDQCFATAPTVIEYQQPITVLQAPNPAPMVNSFTTITVVDQINSPLPSAPPAVAMYPTIDPNALNNLEAIRY